MYQEPFDSGEPENIFSFDDVDTSDVGTISPQILPFDTPVRIDIHVEGNMSLSLEGEICKCKRVSGGWQAEMCFHSIFPANIQHS